MSTLAIQPRQSGIPGRLISYRVGNLCGIGSRSEQQDSFAFRNPVDVRAMKREGLLAVLADGMGGMVGGQTASRLTVESIRDDAFQKMNRGASIPEQLFRAAISASDCVYQKLQGGGGSTLIACIFYQECLSYVSVGDSGLFLLRDGQLVQVNREQNEYNTRLLETLRADRFGTETADADEEPQALSQFIGMSRLSDIDCFFRPMPLMDGDVFLLCSDGVYGEMNNDQLAACMSLSTPDEICSALERQIMQAHDSEQDNYTALVIQCKR